MTAYNTMTATRCKALQKGIALNHIAVGNTVYNRYVELSEKHLSGPHILPVGHQPL